jgi:excisionase family DNA binding protein
MAENKRPQKPYMSSNEAADMLMVHPTTIRRWNKKGYIQGVKTLGGQTRFSRTHIEGVASRVASFDEGTK